MALTHRCRGYFFFRNPKIKMMQRTLTSRRATDRLEPLLVQLSRPKNSMTLSCSYHPRYLNPTSAFSRTACIYLTTNVCTRRLQKMTRQKRRMKMMTKGPKNILRRLTVSKLQPRMLATMNRQITNSKEFQQERLKLLGIWQIPEDQLLRQRIWRRLWSLSQMAMIQF